MAQQYLRKASLVVELAGNGADTLLDLSKLQFTFQTQAWTLATPKAIQLRIYNLNDKTAKSVTEAGAKIFLSAGYEGNNGSIFEGEIVQVRTGRENGTDTYLDITAVDGDGIYNYSLVNITVAAGTDVIGRVGAIAKAAGISTGTVAVQTNGEKLHRGRTYFGLAREHLSSLCGTIGANWTINNGKLDVIGQNAYKEGDIPLLTTATGMIGVPEQMELGISVRVLLNPHIEINKQVQIDNKSIQQYQYGIDKESQSRIMLQPPTSADGKYKVLYVTHTGDTRGNDWFTDLVCYAGEHITNADTQGLFYNTTRLQY